MKVDDANDRSIRVCEAIDCYEAASESIIVSAGKFGTLTLNLCHECAITKFQKYTFRRYNTEEVEGDASSSG